MRKSRPKKRALLPDPRFKDEMVTRFINNMMYSGKKSTAFDIFYDSMTNLEKKATEAGVSPLDYWKKALENVTPQVEVKSRRVGGATFQVPTEIPADRKLTVSMKNVILFARKRAGKSMADKLSAEIIAAYNNEGGAYKKKEDTHKMAEANKAFSHFRF
ncbi:MAG: 30S ribosomal protein S7 [Bacteroidetes bacterium HGW-Bacteroidetes-21]|jgi:small subunit ribosomal protein S7|nr:MAG: 30S ribosomal protein S7 [Bacteroidetes bacterium HGW-Bacteroidetes-21]